MTDPHVFPPAIDFRNDMGQCCLKAIANVHGRLSRTYCGRCRRELAQDDTAARTWHVVIPVVPSVKESA